MLNSTVEISHSSKIAHTKKALSIFSTVAKLHGQNFLIALQFLPYNLIESVYRHECIGGNEFLSIGILTVTNKLDVHNIFEFIEKSTHEIILQVNNAQNMLGKIFKQ